MSKQVKDEFNQQRRRKPVLKQADPYFLPYGRLRIPPGMKIELEFHILQCPFEVREGDFIV